MSIELSICNTITLSVSILHVFDTIDSLWDTALKITKLQTVGEWRIDRTVGKLSFLYTHVDAR